MRCAAILPAALRGPSRLSGSELISRISLVSELWFIRLLGEEKESRHEEGGKSRGADFIQTSIVYKESLFSIFLFNNVDN